MIRHLMLLTTLVVTPLGAQQGATNQPTPSISVSSRGEIKVSPDAANIHISVQTKAATAAAAAAENARKQKAVIDALRALGLAQSQVSTIGYNVMPDQRYEPNREPVVVGYTVTNTVLVDVTDLSMVGRIIDTALSRGANMISSLNFFASNTEAARRQAIASAVEKARGDAQAAARAAGGSLGGLLEVNVGWEYPPPRPMAMEVMAAARAAADTPINPGEQTVTVQVNTRWAFVGTR